MLTNLEKYDIVLGSNSPRRRQLLEDMDVKFRVEAIGGIDERYPDELPVDDIAQYLACLKSNGHPLQPNELLITADTIVVCDNQVLGKPHDAADARRMLQMLSGRRHRVISGVCLRTKSRAEALSEVSVVKFAPLNAAEIAYYVEHYSPLDKAGAYGIQEWIGNIGIEGIEGDFYNIMGLPTCKLYQALKTF